VEFEIYFILHLKAVEFRCHNSNTSKYFVVVYLARNVDSRDRGLLFSYAARWYNRWCLWVVFSFWSECFYRKVLLVITKEVHCRFFLITIVIVDLFLILIC